MELIKSKKKFIETKNKSDPVLKKHVGLIHCENKLTFLQRKISNVFLFNALDGIEKQDIHQISLKQLCSLIGYRSNDIELIKKSIKVLISTVMEWNLLEDRKFINEDDYAVDARSWNASALLAGASMEGGMVSYSYSPQIKTVLSSLEIYGRINLFVQAKFNSSYSLVLYENCVRFKNISKTAWFKLDLFRSLMGVVDGQYESFKELKRNVITVAVNEINLKSDICIEPEYQKNGRSVAGIRFIISENNKYQPSFQKMVKPAEVDAFAENNQLFYLDMLCSEFNLQEKQAKEILKNYDVSYLLEKIELVRKSKKVENAGAYLVAALKNDYKESSKPELQERSRTGIKETHLRETCEASEARSLKNKYTDYQFKTYEAFLLKRELFKKIQTEFLAYMSQTNPVMSSVYKKKGLHSPLARKDFIAFVDEHYADLKIECLEFDEYLTEEEVV